MVIHKTLDTRGAFCPGPLIDLISLLKSLQTGDQVNLLSTDSGTARDVPTWCENTGNELISSEKKNDHWHLIIRKGSARP